MPVLFPAHTVALAERVPATEAGALVMTTVSVCAAQLPFPILHTRRYVPATSPLRVVDGEETDPKTAVEGPAACVQLPLPNKGLLAVSKVLVVLHKTWSTPAFAVVDAP